MNQLFKDIVYWAPRSFGVLYGVFISLFALDAFNEAVGFWDTLLALLTHLIPVAAIAIALYFSWKREWLGGLLFNLYGILYIVVAWGRFPTLTYLVVSGPLFLIGILFLIGWFYKNDIRTIA